MTEKDSGKPGSKVPERRKKMRRSGTDRREQMRWGLENPIRRKGPGRRSLDRFLTILDPKR